MMDPLAKIRWTEKLREDGRVQSFGSLRTETGQCCMDIVNEMAIEDKLVNPPCFDETREVYVYTDSRGNQESGVILDVAVKRYGISQGNPYVFVPAEFSEKHNLPKRIGENYSKGKYIDCHVCLGCLNDTYRVPFGLIAELIENDKTF